eukprot:snap_masked-scaffold_52-processed-gene-1.45-mRNA-1 protein AED:1.00 eAED:1.00 QI:0/0/0/0/1/1/11/0/773
MKRDPIYYAYRSPKAKKSLYLQYQDYNWGSDSMEFILEENKSKLEFQQEVIEFIKEIDIDKNRKNILLFKFPLDLILGFIPILSKFPNANTINLIDCSFYSDIKSSIVSTQMKTLRISSLSTDIGLKTLLKIFPNIKNINVECKEHTENQISIICKNISEFNQLENIWIGHENAGLQNLTILSDSIKILQKLKFLNFHPRINVDPRKGYNLLKYGIKDHRALQVVRIFDNGEIFYDLLNKNFKKLLKENIQKYYNFSIGVPEYRINFFGDGRSGKTSTIRTMLGLKFSPLQRSTPLMDNNYIAKIDKSSKVKVEWHSVSRYERNLERFSNYLPTQEDIIQNEEKKFNFRFEEEFLEDLASNEKYYNNFFNYHYSNHAKILEKWEVEYIQIYDFGGQQSFYAVHEIFLTNFGYYVLIFNASKLKDIDLNSLNFWFQSIRKNAPDAEIVFVATNWKKLRKKQGINSFWFVLEKVSRKIGIKKKILRKHFYSLENSLGPDSYDAQNLRSKLSDFESNENSGLLLPETKVIRLAEYLFMDYIVQEYNHLKFSEFIQKGLSSGFEKEECEYILKRYHELGLLIFFSKISGVDKNNSIISFAPTWLSHALGNIFNDFYLHTFVFKVSKKFIREHKKYATSGILSLDLAKDVLRKYASSEVSFLIHLCIHMKIMLSIPNPKNKKKIFILPHLVPKKRLSSKGNIKIPARFHFEIKCRKYISRKKSWSRFLTGTSLDDVNEQCSLLFLENEQSIGVVAHGTMNLKYLKKLCGKFMNRFIYI